jgi:hypothetical protein
MHPYFDYFLKEFAPQSDTVMPTVTEVEAYRRALPDALLDFWAKAGWGSHADGLFWLVNPADYESIARAWLDGLSLPVAEPFHVIARSAFGRLIFWGKTGGKCVMVDPVYSQVLTTPPNRFLAQGREEFAITGTFASISPESFDLDDVKDKPLFKRALKKLGKLNPDEMYGFEPALALGGTPELGQLAKVKLAGHLAFLRQLNDVELIHLDVSGKQ